MKIRTLIAAFALSTAPVLVMAPAAMADTDPVYTGTFSNVAVEGYDAVAYFTQGEPTKGSKQFKTSYNGAEFRFSSAGNLALFKADPAKYAPQFGGYCAWAVSQGYTAKGDASHWAIVDDKLYLNYNKKVQATWNEDRAGFIEKAETEWPSILAD